MNVKTKVSKKGLSIKINKEYNITYPPKVWEILSNKTKRSILDNLVYSKLASYSAILYKKIRFQSGRPYLKSFLDKSAIHDFPRFADEDNTSTKRLINNFLNADFEFDADPEVPEEEGLEEGMIISISFGKDSLLSYGIARELNFGRKLIFVKDFSDMEWFHKKKIISSFEKIFREKIHILRDKSDDIHRDKKINKIDSSGIFGSNAMNGYILMLLPFAYHFKMKCIVFGNEQNFNDFFINTEGYKCYPSFEQSSECMIEQNNALKKFTKTKIQVSSLVEPLYNIAEVKILFNRYPEIAKYTMSCSHSEIENKENRWCNSCPMCAKAFLYLAANGVNPKTLNFNQNLFEKRYGNLYPLFNRKPERIYEKPKAVRDEQLLAFYLAFKNKTNGYLVDRFKDKFLEEAKEREDELFNRFFKVYDSVSISDKIKERINSIYKEELGKCP